MDGWTRECGRRWLTNKDCSDYFLLRCREDPKLWQSKALPRISQSQAFGLGGSSEGWATEELTNSP